MKQRFFHGDVVRIAKTLPEHMSHFESDFEAVILATYRDLYDGDNCTDFSVMNTKTKEETSWYPEDTIAKFVRHMSEQELVALRFGRSA